MMIDIIEVNSRKQLRDFIYLPSYIHANHENWVPPIYMDEWNYFNPKKNDSFSHCDTIMLLAYHDNQPVGRVMGIIHRSYNQKHNENHARFAYLETENNPFIHNALMNSINVWAYEKGMTHLVGPIGFSDKDPQGFMIEGFNEPVTIATNCNQPYMVDLITGYGFKPKLDLVVYKIPVPETQPEIITKIEERFRNRKTDLKVLEFSSRQKVRPYIRPVLSQVNQTFTDIYGFIPFTPREMDEMANRYLYLINPEFIKIIVNGKNDVIAFVLGMSDLSKGFRKSRGKLLPFGFLHLLFAGKESAQLNLLLGAIHPDYQGRGLDMLMGARLIDSARKNGKKVMDSHLELETNLKVRAEMERMGGKVYKRYRIFIKEL